MSDLIDREALQHRLAELMSSSEGNENIGVYKALKEVNWIPSIDAVEVVRCGECKYRCDAKFNRKGFLICPVTNMEITDEDYCSYGEKWEVTQ